MVDICLEWDGTGMNNTHFSGANSTKKLFYGEGERERGRE